MNSTLSDTNTWQEIEITSRQSNKGASAATTQSTTQRASARDVGATALIAVSNGPTTDPRLFYSTTHSTTYTKYPTSQTLSVPINGVHSADLKVVVRTNNKGTIVHRKTGYTKNLVPYVEYDKAVDENSSFRTTESYVTRTVDDYRSPPRPTNVLAEEGNGLSPMVDSGFTRLPKFNVTKDGTKSKERKESQMKSSYQEGRLQWKEPIGIDKARIIPSQSAYISDAGEIQTLGYESGNNVSPASEKSKSTDKKIKSNKIKDDGFTRSVRLKDPLRVDIDPHAAAMELSYLSSHPKTLSTLRHNDLAEWVQKMDPNARQSLSRVVHSSLNAEPPLTETRIGLKEATGAIWNNPKYVFEQDMDARERLTTETSRRFNPPKWKPLDETACDKINSSGFSHGNKFVYNLDAKKESKMTPESLHPTVARYLWLKERGLHTQKPTQLLFIQ